MIKIENYKLFVNSKDFEKIYKIAKLEFVNSSIDYIKSIEKYLSICIEKQSILLLYSDQNIIGFYIINIVNKKVKLSFAYIDPKYRGKGYNHILLEAAINNFKSQIDSFTTFIHFKNIASLKSLYKLIDKFNLNYIKDELIDEKGQKFYKFTLQGFK
jgi:GNAT superfamily N-acetyltransferase